MPLPMIIAPVAAFVLVSACAQPPSVRAHVSSKLEDIAVGTTFSLAELRKLSEESGRKIRHEPLGFYAAAVEDRVRLYVHNNRHESCPGFIELEITITLKGRHIEIGRELKDTPCRFGAVLEHYRRYAATDEAVFSRYVVAATKVLQQADLAALVRSAGTTSGNERAGRAIHAAIKPVLDDMDAARQEVPNEFDTPAAINRMMTACTGHA